MKVNEKNIKIRHPFSSSISIISLITIPERHCFRVRYTSSRHVQYCLYWTLPLNSQYSVHSASSIAISPEKYAPLKSQNLIDSELPIYEPVPIGVSHSNPTAVSRPTPITESNECLKNMNKCTQHFQLFCYISPLFPSE